MSEQITAVLNKKLGDLVALGEIDPETRFNALKEELQYYVLNRNEQIVLDKSTLLSCELDDLLK